MARITGVAGTSEGAAGIGQLPGGVAKKAAAGQMALAAVACALLAVALALASTAPASARIYTITSLGTLGGPTSEANAINQNGEVAGTAEVVVRHRNGTKFVEDLPRAFRYHGGYSPTSMAP
jgi:uncharacterized membrane protein